MSENLETNGFELTPPEAIQKQVAKAEPQRWRLLASARTVGALRGAIAQFWFTAFDEVAICNQGSIILRDKVVDGVRARRQGRRWRFEMEVA